jgi:hypothetical protein
MSAVSDCLTAPCLSVQEAKQIAWTLSRPSKMPGHGYSIPAETCKTGAKLRKVEGSTCSHCYACKGRYCFPNVQNAMHKRHASLRDFRWVDAMVTQIAASKDECFRWHDSGDLQGVWHLANIVRVCEGTPHVRHWLPTREYGTVQAYVDNGGQIPGNLNIRLSAHFVGKLPPKAVAGCTFSTVSTDNEFGTAAHYCPAPKQGNVCGTCRACWDSSVGHVSYLLH